MNCEVTEKEVKDVFIEAVKESLDESQVEQLVGIEEFISPEKVLVQLPICGVECVETFFFSPDFQEKVKNHKEIYKQVSKAWDEFIGKVYVHFISANPKLKYVDGLCEFIKCKVGDVEVVSITNPTEKLHFVVADDADKFLDWIKTL